MSTYGLTDQGFNIKPLDQILNDINTKQQQGISPTLNVSPSAIMGIANGIVAQAAYDNWQMAQALYAGMDRDVATGDQLTSLALLTGTRREDATATTVNATVNVDNGFSAAAGTMFASVEGQPNNVFTNVVAVSNTSGSAANVAGEFKAVNAGPTPCYAGTLIVISQPLTGWNSITNAADGTPGQAVQTDASLRIASESELSTGGSTTAAALRDNVLADMQPDSSTPTTTATISCTVLYNDTPTTDANNVPPNSVEVIAYQPGYTLADNNLLAALILSTKAAGIATYGLTSATILDSQGNSETIRFTRPSELALYIALTVKTDPTKFPSNGATLIKDLLVAYGNSEYAPGASVYVKALQGVLFPNPNDPAAGVAGILDVTAFAIDTISVPVNTANIAISLRQVAKLDTARITVTVT